MNAIEVNHIKPVASAAHDILLEQTVLGTVLVYPGAMAQCGDLEPEDFFEPLHSHLFRKFQEMSARGVNVSAKLAIAALGEQKRERVGDLTIAQYVARLAAEAETLTQVHDYAKALRDLADKRKLQALGEMLSAIDSAAPAEAAATMALETADEVLAKRTNEATRPLSVGAAATLSAARMAEAFKTGGGLIGIPSGLMSIDAKTGGFRRGDFIVLAGRPGMGKSGFAVTIARLMASAGRCVHLFSLEMDAPSISDRMISDWLYSDRERLSYQRIARGQVTAEQGQRVLDAARALEGLPIKIDPQPRLSMPQIISRARAHGRALERSGKRLDAVIIDHMHIVRPSDRYAGNAVKEAGEISAACKAMAKELNVPVITLAQLNRAVETRDQKRPTLADLRESGAIEQDADLIIFLFREAYYLQTATPEDSQQNDKRIARLADVENILEAIIAKHRNGPTGTVQLFCDIECNAIRDLERGYSEKAAA